MKKLFSATPFYLPEILAMLRIAVGLLLIYHGIEVFNAKLMQEYATWDTFKGQPAALMTYAGKSAEFIAGISLTLGLLTRIGALLCVGTLGYITFFIGHGRFWYEDQHPFMFVLFGLLFCFAGAGKWSLDGLLFSSEESN